MFGLTALGVIHTAISLVAVGAGAVTLIRFGAISLAHRAGGVYVVATAATCLTGFGIFQHGGIGPPHILGAVTLVVLSVAVLSERTSIFGRLADYVMTIGYSLTFFLHWIPGIVETATRLPPSAPMVSDREAPELQMAIGIAFVVFLIGVGIQMLHLRSKRRRDLAALLVT